jgi:hypothetical protein
MPLLRCPLLARKGPTEEMPDRKVASKVSSEDHEQLFMTTYIA